MKWVLLLFIFFNISIFALTTVEKGTQIIFNNEEYNRGYQSVMSEVEMILINAHKDEIVRSMIIKAIETKEDGDKSILEFKKPLDVKGTKLLTWVHKDKSDEQWLFLPAINRVKRINAKNRSGSFMGSEFSYEDISSDEIEKYTYNFVEESALSSRNVWVIERFPKDKKSGYSKQVAYIDKVYRQPLKIISYDKKGDLYKTLYFSEYKKYNKWWFYDYLEVENHQTKKSSKLIWKNRQIERFIPDREFTKRNLI